MYRRINVTGNAGAGKSTVAAKLGNLLNLPIFGLVCVGILIILTDSSLGSDRITRRQNNRTLSCSGLPSLCQTAKPLV